MTKLKDRKILIEGMEFKVSINSKVVNLQGRFVGNRFCVDSSSINNHPALTPEEKEKLKCHFQNDKSLLIV